jgi:hypothetical protein
MWLRGSFIFIGTVNDLHSLLRTLIHRDQDNGLLWIGVFIVGRHHKAFREGSAGWLV